MFKNCFKYYKSKAFSPDLSEVIDFENIDSENEKVRKFQIDNGIEFDSNCLELKPLENWDIYEIIEKPGLIFIKNPFTSLGQRYWTVQCLDNFTKKPNKLNLDPFNKIPKHEDWWQICQKTNNYNLLKQLRWATLGYHHNWDTKIYSDDSKNDFPTDLAALSENVAKLIGYYNFKAQAAIVNFYHLDSTLSGHTDHSEVNLEAPLISFSFGQSAIFLLGGKTLDEKPLAVFLHSGDIIIMTKETRLCYHGVPKITKADKSPWDSIHIKNEKIELAENQIDLLSNCLDEDFWKPFGQYLDDSRININVRQVLPEGQNHL